jgi:hypothetical protein
MSDEILNKINEARLADSAFWARHAAIKSKRFDEWTPLILNVAPIVPSFHCGEDRVYFEIRGSTKAEFSEVVTKIAQVLNDPPTITVNPSEYIAEFMGGKIHVYLDQAEDCKFIEETVTETRTVRRPHPACVAAMQTLEQV